MAECGVFLRAVILASARKRAEALSLGWMGSHLKPEKVQEVIQQIENTSGEKKKPVPLTVEETANEWTRLAQFMQGKS